jgi:glycosyltransferase 2 family protein
MKKQLINGLRFLFFLSIGFGILWYLYSTGETQYHAECQEQGLPLQPYWMKLQSDFAGVNYFWVLMLVLAFTLSNISRAMRWMMLLNPLKTDGKKVGFANAFMATMVLYVTNYVIPRAGEVARCGVMARYENIPIEKSFGTVFLDRLLDVLCLGIFFLLALVLEFDVLWGFLTENAFQSSEQGGEKGFSWLLLIGGIGLVGLIVVFIFRKQLQKTVLYKKIESLALGFVEGIKTIQKLDNLGLFIGHSIFIWVMYYLMLYLAFFSYAPTAHLGPVTALLVFIFGALGIVVPAPGGIGSYQYFVSLALATFYGISESEAFSFSNISFFAPFLCNVTFGVLAIILLPIFNKTKDS